MKRPAITKLSIFIPFLFFFITLNLLVFSLGSVSASSKQNHPAVSELPLPVQSSISGVVGRDNGAYHALGVEGGYRVENRRHSLEGKFTKQGLRVRMGEYHWALSLKGYGYGDAIRSAGVVSPEAFANRVEYRREGMREWYVNGPFGVEQGFTIEAAP